MGRGAMIACELEDPALLSRRHQKTQGNPRSSRAGWRESECLVGSTSTGAALLDLTFTPGRDP
ncbi:hypothetical protein GCM10025859_65280 [Alicyclobacillus fastidiosus]|nr:hypothetical protein GCM10025859_65280 [Alicyclobacillus fastidiosus]